MAAIASVLEKGATAADAQLASPCSVLSTACPLLAVPAVFAPSDGGLNRGHLAENAARGVVYVQSAPQLTWAESARQCYDTDNAARESAARSTTEQGGGASHPGGSRTTMVRSELRVRLARPFLKCGDWPGTFPHSPSGQGVFARFD